MYIHPDARLNRFKDVKIPSTQELFILHGFKAPLGHGDDAADGIPDNRQGIDNLDRAMIAKKMAEMSAAEFEAMIASQAPSETQDQKDIEQQSDPKPTEAV